jgi:flavin-dependent dehydrogenase
MQTEKEFDVIVIGAGPAGATCAVRLVEMGYRVCIVEKHLFPRRQIGESLSPGVQNIFSFLNASDAFNHAVVFQSLPTNVLWENENVPSTTKHSNFIVDRSVMDQKMLDHCIAQGATSYCPAEIIELNRIEGIWWGVVQSGNNLVRISASIVLDCKGRSGTRHIDRLPMGASCVAMWTHVSQNLLPLETNVEALEDCWIWGSPVSDYRYRIMIFIDPSITSVQQRYAMFKEKLSKSTLFKWTCEQISASSIESFSVQTYVHQSPWNENYFRLGESAFTLDPMSSTGVEKAMRSALKMAVAVNTILKTGDELMSKKFILNSIRNDTLAHQRMANDFYKNVWSFNASEFWGNRIHHNTISQVGNQFVSSLSENITQLPNIGSYEPRAIHIPTMLNDAWNKRTTKSVNITLVETICVENNLLVNSQAMRHPNLTSDLAYVNNVSVVKLLDQISEDGIPLSHLIEKWQQQTSKELAQKIACHFIQLNVLEIECGDFT